MSERFGACGCEKSARAFPHRPHRSYILSTTLCIVAYTPDAHFVICLFIISFRCSHGCFFDFFFVLARSRRQATNLRSQLFGLFRTSGGCWYVYYSATIAICLLFLHFILIFILLFLLFSSFTTRSHVRVSLAALFPPSPISPHLPYFTPQRM